MTHEPSNDVIGQALRAYVQEEPQPGLESRILNRVRRRERRRVWLWGGLAATCAAAGFGIVWGFDAPVQTLALRPAPRIEAAPMERTPARVTVRMPSLRLTGDQQELLRLVTDYPEKAREIADRLANPISIEQIQIAPLSTEDTQEEKNQ